MNDPHDMEALAAQEHESWAKWTRWMLGEIDQAIHEGSHVNGEPLAKAKLRAELSITVMEGLRKLDCVKRWRRQMKTRYVDLSEKEKESDRKVVREKLPLYRPDEVAKRGGVGRRG